METHDVANPEQASSPSVHMKMEYSCGPIPSPEELIKYGEVRSDIPDLILAEWLKEAEERRAGQRKEMELRELESKSDRALILLKFSLVAVFVLSMIGAAFFLLANRQWELAAALLSTPIVIGIINAVKGGKSK